jgi:curved DNA-binding protein CbpA
MVRVGMRWSHGVDWVLGLLSGIAGRLARGAPVHTLYEVLALPADADAQRIKAAYRALARRFHPDINAGDTASAERLAQINYAYATLGNAEARAAYDRDLAQRRAAVRRRTAAFAATGVVTFALTASLVSLMVRRHSQAAPDAGAAGARKAPRGELAPTPPAQPIANPAPVPNWMTYRDVRFDFALRYPAGIFAFDAAQSGANVQTFVSRDGSAVLRIVAAENTSGITLGGFRSALVKERYAGASFNKAPRRRHWFALSGTRGDEVFLERITFSCDGKSMHGWQMKYPSSRRATYDEIAKLVLQNHPHGNGPGADCEGARPKAQPKAQARRRRD